MQRKWFDTALVVLEIALAAAAIGFFALLPGILALLGIVAGAVFASGLAGMTLRGVWERLAEAPAAERRAAFKAVPAMTVLGE